MLARPATLERRLRAPFVRRPIRMESTMTVVAIGLNHRTAPLAMLEQVSFAADVVPKLLAEVAASEVVTEAVVVSTCNRTEVYVHAERFHDAFRDVRDAIGLVSGVDPEQFNPYLYVHYHDAAARHLFEVAAGLDSVVLGEHEILGQVGRAWELARAEGAAGPLLNLLFQRAVESGKKVRTDTDIGRSTASLSHAAVSLIAEHRPDVAGATVLLVGAGELGASVALALRRKHAIEPLVANRTAARGIELASELEGRSIPFAHVNRWLDGLDVVICATGAPEPVLSVEALAGAARPERPLLVLDLAVPRDVPAEAAQLDGVRLLDLTDLQAHANRGVDARAVHLGSARRLVNAELERYAAASSARQVAPLIGDLHGWADAIRAAEIERYAARLARMADDDRATVEALSRSIVAKLLHQPTITLKGAAGTAKGARLAEAARELFDRS
jgi:glutamyl-tRNA reductase